MQQLEYANYLDRVHGCWIGKCVGGTIGAPYEGMKELLDFEFHPSLIENMLPNDDLDLQVLWLSVLEEKGIRFTSRDLADAFFHRCPYAPGEYAFFKKNHARGIHPPVSGWFNNRYYVEGMGCPIRSEIWACVAPGNPALAAHLAARDGVLDHAGNSVHAEQFLAALESAAFFESDLDTLMDVGMSQVPSESRIARLIRDARDWSRTGGDWRSVRDRIVRHYGHADCTNLFQNIGFTILALYFGKGNFITTTMTALNCGFDTDCTASTSGAILGILHGGERLLKANGFPEQSFILEVDAPRRSGKIRDLAEDTCRVGLHFAEHLNRALEIASAPAVAPIPLAPPDPVEMSVEYGGTPSIAPGQTRAVRIHFRNTTDAALSVNASIQTPALWSAAPATAAIQLPPKSATAWELEVSVPPTIQTMPEINLCRVHAGLPGDREFTHEFGLAGAAVWEVFGPFWHNNVEMPRLKLKESYYAHIPGKDKDDNADQVRTYHLNTRIDPAREFMTPEELESHGRPGDATREPVLFFSPEDRFSVNDVVGFQGPCAVYMIRRMISPEDRTVGVLVGHTDAFRLWINGNLISERDTVDWWTAENVHVHDVPLKKGVNTIVVKLSRRAQDALFSLLFVKAGACTPHYADFASVVPRVK